ncbi:MAG: 30S ribosomal protein S19e [Candidatus Diapherotrites archaeon]
MKVYEVPATELIELIAKEFEGRLTQPEFSLWVKTGSHRERAPARKDWWFVRTASILYRVYTDGPVGTESLRTYYGGRKNRGVKPEKFKKAGGKIIRTCLQALEKEELIKKSKKGREITSKGKSYMNSKAKELNIKLPERKKIELIETIEVKEKTETKPEKEIKKEKTEEKKHEGKKEQHSKEEKKHEHETEKKELKEQKEKTEAIKEEKTKEKKETAKPKEEI